MRTLSTNTAISKSKSADMHAQLNCVFTRSNTGRGNFQDERVVESEVSVDDLALAVVSRLGLLGTEASTRAQVLADHIKHVRSKRFRSALEDGWSWSRASTRELPGLRGHKFAVHYLKGGREHRFPWFLNEATAYRALAIMQGKYGQRNAIIYVD